jgi:hypothetical protein
MSASSARITAELLHLHPCKMTVVQELYHRDEARLTFIHCMMEGWTTRLFCLARKHVSISVDM